MTQKQVYAAIPEYRIPIHAPGGEVIHVHTADFIPDSMVGQFRGKAAGYMQVSPAREEVVTGLGSKGIAPTVRPGYRRPQELPPPAPGVVRNAHHHIMSTLVARGMPVETARSIVTRAGLRVGAKTNRGLHRGWIRGRRVGIPSPTGFAPYRDIPLAVRAQSGMGAGASVPEGVLAYANETQEAHKGLINKYAAAQTGPQRAEIRNEIDALYSGWTDYGMGVKNDVPPFQWNRADPTDAVLLAVRDDIRNTIDLIDAGKAQVALAKQIALLPKPGRLPGLPGMPEIKMPDIPWYVWGGAAALAAAVASKAAHLW